MTRSEERLRVGTETREAGRARLRKHVVTEHQQVTVRCRTRRCPSSASPSPTPTGARPTRSGISEEEHEVTLHAERPVVDTETAPLERVRLGTETVRDQETVSGEVRKEQIELDDGRHRRRPALTGRPLPRPPAGEGGPRRRRARPRPSPR